MSEQRPWHIGRRARSFEDEVRHLNAMIPVLERRLYEAQKWIAEAEATNAQLMAIIEQQDVAITELKAEKEAVWSIIEGELEQ